jgi:mono/diheme cytochrome c family protein
VNKFYLVIITLLLLVIAGGAYKFIVQGSVTESSDGRRTIHLSASERNLVLGEMRAFLASVQQITQGVAESNMERVVEYAKKAGRAAQGEVPGSLVGKLPLEFKKLGFDTHSKFDQLALDAESLGDANQVSTQLAELMQNCVGCHAVYRIDVEQE